MNGKELFVVFRNRACYQVTSLHIQLEEVSPQISKTYVNVELAAVMVYVQRVIQFKDQK